MWKTWNRELGSFTNRMGIERGVGNTWGWPVRLTELSSVDFERTHALSFGFGWVWSGGGSRVRDGNGLWVDWCCLCLELSCGFFWSKWCEAIRQMPKIHLISELIQDKQFSSKPQTDSKPGVFGPFRSKISISWFCRQVMDRLGSCQSSKSNLSLK